MSSGPWSLFLGAFVDELLRLGVHDVVVSPGSRSTPLAMMLHASDFDLHVDIDERGAAYFGLGLAKASGRPVALLCTSGTAAANYYPAICEAATSRVPLIVLTADRPHELRNLGAAQTTDQIKMFGDMPVFFHEMPLPEGSPAMIAFARQIAREGVIRALGTPRGVVHLNFPFVEPLMPDLTPPELFTAGRRDTAPLVESCGCALDRGLVERLNSAIAGKRGVILCGEGDYPDEIVDLAQRLGFPVLADPLSNLRRLDHPTIVSAYDGIFRAGVAPEIEVVIRLGQYPVSKATFSTLQRIAPLTIVVDEAESRDFNHLTDIFVRTDAANFVLASEELLNDIGAGYLATWRELDDRQRAASLARAGADARSEEAFVLRMLEDVEADSLLWAANSMAIRHVDTLLHPGSAAGAPRVMCNRGLSGIDGTISSAIGTAMEFKSATLLIGDLAFVHDLNALHLNREVEVDLTIVVVNNNGGGIFCRLPQCSTDPYFERLFLTPHDVDLVAAVRGFGIEPASVDDIDAFAQAYREARSRPGIKIIEIRVDMSELKERHLARR